MSATSWWRCAAATPTRCHAAVGGVGGARPDRGARTAPLRGGRRRHRGRRRPGRQAADAEPAAAQEPDHRRGAGAARRRGRRQRGRRSADVAQPGTARAAVLDRRADLRGGRARHRRHRHPRPFGAVARQGRKQRLVPIGRPAVSALDAYFVRGRPDLARRGRAHRRSFSMPAAAGCRGKAHGRCCRTPPNGRASPRQCLRTPFGTPLPPTCSTAVLTSASCRSCSATHRSPPRRSTHWSRCTHCGRCGREPTPGRVDTGARMNNPAHRTVGDPL